MAQMNPTGAVHKIVETEYLDESGQVICSYQFTDEMSQAPDGSIITHTKAKNKALSSGESHNPGMSAGADPLLVVGTCPLCVSPQKRFPWSKLRQINPLCNVKYLQHCHRCGQPACPRHRRRSRRDGCWRCLPCHLVVG